jgi:hypothetical protein
MANPTSGPNSSKPTTGAVVAGVYNAAGETLVDGQASPVQLDINGNIKVAATITPSGTQNVNIADVAGSPPALTNPLPVELSDGTNALGTTANPIQVSLAHTGTNATPVVVSGAVTSTDAATSPTGSAVPADASYNGLDAATQLHTAVSNGQLVGAMGDKFGRTISTLNGMRDIIGTASVQNTGASGTLIGQIGSTYCDIIDIVLTNESSTATVVSISDGTTTYKFALAANGGISKSYVTPLPATSTNTNWTVSNSASSTVDCVVLYVKNK